MRGTDLPQRPPRPPRPEIAFRCPSPTFELLHDEDPIVNVESGDRMKNRPSPTTASSALPESNQLTIGSMLDPRQFRRFRSTHRRGLTHQSRLRAGRITSARCQLGGTHCRVRGQACAANDRTGSDMSIRTRLLPSRRRSQHRMRPGGRIWRSSTISTPLSTWEASHPRVGAELHPGACSRR